ncbi:MAG: hypothetical protein CMM58_00335 [Rhodospirillaceae bacterium]|nr:hypothetical protein [Rhodospirillaceae bacterium]|tara:strand:- start:1148 stop:2743 length:1596 start_codon:yes stop_codon:yes gene_type:complete
MRTKQEHNKINRRILYLWFPHFSVERLKHSENRVKAKNVNTRAIVLTQSELGRCVVVSACDLATQLGIIVGGSLGDALATCSNLIVSELDSVADKIELKGLADWCGKYTPLVSVDKFSERIGDAGIWLDITGCAHLFDGETELLNNISKHLSDIGWTVRSAIADTAGSAWAVARYGGLSSQIILPEAQQMAISRLPLTALRLPMNLVEDLSKVGLRKINELARVPRAPLRTRFGSIVRQRLDQALGLEKESISPQTHHFPYLTRLVLLDPVSTSEAIMKVIKHLLFQLIQVLVIKSLGVRQLQLSLYRIDGKLQKLTIGISQTSLNIDLFLKLFAEKLDSFALESAVDVITLEATVVDILNQQQMHLGSKNRPVNVRLSELVDRLTNKFGVSKIILRSVEEGYCPDRSEPIVCVDSILDSPKLSMQIKSSLDQFLNVRPLYLMEYPEQIDPILLCQNEKPKHFFWRNKDIQIRRVNGPERISPEWWCIENYHMTRDYFRVEDTEGQRYWLFKEFTKKDNQNLNWYLHGFFA